VRVLERGLFGRLREAEDRSGVLVYLTGFREPAPESVALLRQRDESFDPQLLPVVAGQTVAFPNEDPIYHNVFSVSSVQAFDLGQYKAGEAPRSQVFERPGLVPVYCNIHPKMLSYVVVLENGAFARTDAAGGFEIRAPSGRVTLNAWIPGAERVSRELELREGERAQVELELHRVERTPRHKRKDGSDYPKRPYKR
jgi:plastocyanin